MAPRLTLQKKAPPLTRPLISLNAIVIVGALSYQFAQAQVPIKDQPLEQLPEHPNDLQPGAPPGAPYVSPPHQGTSPVRPPQAPDKVPLPAFSSSSDSQKKTTIGPLAETHVEFDFKSPPPFVAQSALVRDIDTRHHTAVELAIVMHQSDKELQKCQKLRHDLEAQIGPKPGSWTVHKGWVDLYQSCLKERLIEINSMRSRMIKLHEESVADTGDESTLAWQGAAKLDTRLSLLNRNIYKEYETQRQFVVFYMSGTKSY